MYFFYKQPHQQHLTYELPDGVDVSVEIMPDGAIDFNFAVDGEIISVFGGTDMEGNPLLTWEELGIKRVDKPFPV